MIIMARDHVRDYVHNQSQDFAPEEAITVEQALRAYTYGSAHAAFLEKEMGSLEVGKVADFTVLSADPTAVPREHIREIEVLATFIDGRAAFDAHGDWGQED